MFPAIQTQNNVTNRWHCPLNVWQKKNNDYVNEFIYLQHMGKVAAFSEAAIPLRYKKKIRSFLPAVVTFKVFSI